MHAIPGRGPVAECLRSGRSLLEVVVEANDNPDLVAVAEAAHDAGVRVRREDRGALDRLSQGVLHQGVVAIAERFTYMALADIPDTDLVVVLDGVTDPQNLGAIARSAEAAGAGAIILRERRSAHVTPAAEKAAAGAFSWIPVVQVTNIVRALEELADRSFWSVGLAGEAASPLWECALLDAPVALVIGAEGSGLSRLVRDRVDALVHIPMGGRMTSLNASAASAVALFEVRRRRDSGGRGGGVRPAH
ncbi:MAG: 23S rRNA (guanosine(2251)-2'-O)-methyltransferase RlmB [Nitriliruptorales bacterium]|nr:23S rRNA (guanosine(2251)-2'-O)-methyltransferase RlmB [Nitriliruptorales bacterium]